VQPKRHLLPRRRIDIPVSEVQSKHCTGEIDLSRKLAKSGKLANEGGQISGSNCAGLHIPTLAARAMAQIHANPQEG
jgi:hypothetical protein